MRYPYLVPHRLEEVIFLIQYLGLGTNYSLGQGAPAGGTVPSSVVSKDWSEVAQTHPEFFRVTKKGAATLALRYYQRLPDRAKPPPIAPEAVQKLIDNAFALHERQASRSDVWKSWATLIAGIVAAVTGIATMIRGSS